MTQSQIERIQEIAEANRWAMVHPVYPGDTARGYQKDDRKITVWHGPKGRISGGDLTTRSATSGRYLYSSINGPKLFDKIAMELTA